ncbi:WecB/TagA/CpsF family glycosyltransferase [Deefgea tanakiae]|uniref:WecB/TagA/CpsF family glycosyltransferase n=1 Tax=Deefgea tanakiae TaxID=2865840 RepID=A0ABX8Z6Q7_9NEIS|nr:WecB/TagA/CpsF family glycosyltransferase [Deefgea tanakiae]QZA78236.1 WecB/TagA/CpsF family glycosyltransferase [Deefgea tanakiae]
MKSRLILDKVVPVASYEDAIVKFECFTKKTQTVSIGFINAYLLDQFMQNKIDQDLVDSFSILYRDGIAIKIFMRCLSYAPGINANGTDLNPLLVKSAIDQSLPVALIGDESEVVQKMADKVSSLGAELVCALDGFRSEQVYLDAISVLPRHCVIFLAMGMPKQEKLAQKICLLFPDSGFVIVSTGAFFKFYTNSINRAPIWMRNSGLEWLYRLVKEPRRMFDRYIFGFFRIFRYLIEHKISKSFRVIS